MMFFPGGMTPSWKFTTSPALLARSITAQTSRRRSVTSFLKSDTISASRLVGARVATSPEHLSKEACMFWLSWWRRSLPSRLRSLGKGIVIHGFEADSLRLDPEHWRSIRGLEPPQVRGFRRSGDESLVRVHDDVVSGPVERHPS